MNAVVWGDERKHIKRKKKVLLSLQYYVFCAFGPSVSTSYPGTINMLNLSKASLWLHIPYIEQKALLQKPLAISLSLFINNAL